jgi:hypothetical protein
MTEIRLVLPDSFDDLAFELAADRQGWSFVHEIQETAGQPRELIYRDPDRDTQVHYVEDSFRGVRFLLIHGTGAAATAGIAKSALPVVPTSMILADATQTDDADRLARAVLRLSAIPAELDAVRVLALLEKAATLGSTEVQEAVLLAVSYLEWPSLRPLVERMAAAPDAHVAGMAWTLLDGMG